VSSWGDASVGGLGESTEVEAFLPVRRYASAGFCDSSVSVCPSLRPSVCPSRAGIVSKRRKLASWFLYCLVATRF